MAIRIAVDAMGGDNAPGDIVRGCADFMDSGSEGAGAVIILVGDEGRIAAELLKCGYDNEKRAGKFEIIHAPGILGYGDSPVIMVREGKDTSLVTGLRLLKEGGAGAFVSAGNTGALLAGATLLVGRIRGIERPALGTLLPNETGGRTLLIDSGANAECKPQYLVQFAQMGAVYLEHMLGVKNPRVGLVNIGTEREKGNALVKEAYGLLEQAGVNFAGNLEAGGIPHGLADVAVCDGFVGNVILKHAEGFSKAMFSMIKKSLLSSLSGKVGAVFAKPSLSRMRNTLDPSEVGGAPLIGLSGLVVKAHGGSNARAIFNALRQCRLFIEKDIVGKISEKV